MFVFVNSEQMLQAVCRLYRNYRTKGLDSSLFYYNGRYILTVQGSRAPEAEMILREYAPIGLRSCALTDAWLREHWVLLCDHTAILTLGRIFTRGF